MSLDFKTGTERLLGLLTHCRELIIKDALTRPEGNTILYVMGISDDKEMSWGVAIPVMYTTASRAMHGCLDERLFEYMISAGQERYTGIVEKVLEPLRVAYPSLTFYAPYYAREDFPEDAPLVSVEYPFDITNEVTSEMAETLLAAVYELNRNLLKETGIED